MGLEKTGNPPKTNADRLRLAIREAMAKASIDGLRWNDDITFERAAIAFDAAQAEQIAKLKAALTHALNHLEDANGVIESLGADDEEDVAETRAWITNMRTEHL